MAVTFVKADQDVHDHLARVREEHHEDLCDPKVTVDILMTQEVDGEGNEYATLKHRGHAALAVIKKTSLKERTLGHADALLIIDSVRWGELKERERTALLDHEITHLQVKRNEDGEAELDDARRPKLKLRLHDWELGGFTAVARRHGAHAPEVQSVRSCVDEAGQYYWDWDKPRKVA